MGIRRLVTFRAAMALVAVATLVAACESDDGASSADAMADIVQSTDASDDTGATTDTSSDDGASADTSDTSAGPFVALYCASGRVMPEITGLPSAFRLQAYDGTGEGYRLRIELAAQHEYKPEQALQPRAPEETTVDASGSGTAEAWSLSWDGGSLSVAREGADAMLFTGTADIGEQEDVALTCWTLDMVPPFRYDAATGRCVDGEGTEGRNAVTVPFVRETLDGQCADLTDLDLEEEDYYYPELVGWDLRGADLSQTGLHFAQLTDARFEGTLMTAFDYGYAIIRGSVDDYTALPEGCEPTAGAIDCMR